MGILAGFLNVLSLGGYRSDMVLVGVGLLLRRGTSFNAARTSVVAHVGFGDVRHCRIVGVVNDGGVHVSHVGIVGETTTFPTAALIADTAVAEAVVDASVEAYRALGITALVLIRRWDSRLGYERR